MSTSEENKTMGIIEDVKEGIKSLEEQAKKDGVGLVDVLSEKILSRKLLVWIISTSLLLVDKLTPDQWVAISLGYIGVQGVTDLATKWKSATNG